MDFSINLSFNALLIIFSVAIFASTVLLLWLTSRSKSEPPKRTKPQKLLFYVFCSVILGFVVFSIIYGVIGQRPPLWFVFSALLSIPLLYFGNSSSARQRNFAVFGVLLFAVFSSLMPMIQNQGLIFGPDQWRDFFLTSDIVSKGHFIRLESYSSFYSFVPLFNILNASISSVLGCPPLLVFTISLAIISLIAAFSIYSVALKLSGQVPVAIAAVLLFVLVPRLALTQLIPSTVSLSLSFLAILLFFIGISNGEHMRRMLSIAAFLSFIIAVIHPVGLIPLLTICAGIVLQRYFQRLGRPNRRIVSFAKNVFGLCFFIPLVYWTLDSGVFLGVLNPFLKFVKVFTTLPGHSSSTPVYYTPQYFSGNVELSAFAWAFPVAICGAYVLAVFFTTYFRKRSHNLKISFPRQMSSILSIAGLTLVIAAFVNLALAPGASVERYVDNVSYSLLVFPAALVFGHFLSSKKAIAAFAILLFSIAMVAGLSSPDWAPFENLQFGAVRYTSISYIEAADIAPYFRNLSHIYQDNDIPIEGIAFSEGIDLVADVSYQTVRLAIQEVVGNPNVRKYSGSIFVVKNERIPERGSLDNATNVLFDSGRHLVFIPK